MKVNRETL